MLTKEECLNSLEDLYIEANNAGITYEYVIEDANKMLTQLINEHFELVEKTTTKKLEKEYMELKGFIYYNCVCPNCGKSVCFETQRDTVKHQVNYCWKCGQALDWSEEDVD